MVERTLSLRWSRQGLTIVLSLEGAEEPLGCEVSADQAQGKSPGPDGAGTLCSTCGARFRGGHLGPPPRNAFGQIECECGRAFDKLNALATHKRSCRVAQMMPEE